jgi:hypothetical protein
MGPALDYVLKREISMSSVELLRTEPPMKPRGTLTARLNKVISGPQKSDIYMVISEIDFKLETNFLFTGWYILCRGPLGLI